VGLGSGLEGRVARVVLELVACGGKTLVSDLYGSARVVCAVQNCSSPSVAKLALVSLKRSSSSRISRKVSNRGGGSTYWQQERWQES
jgi:hypothetical protein